MEDASQSENQPVAPADPAVEAGAAFLAALFAESDTILFRPIETWVEDGKKRSRVDYGRTCYRKAVPLLIKSTLRLLLRLAEKERVNVFFGVCPRLGDKGRFDLACQIRTVRALWTDIDHVTVEEARERIAKAGLPQPSIIVNSGNGVHIYWLLDEPYVVDDCGEPIAVETEWLPPGPNGKKRPRKYVVENGNKIYLDERPHFGRLSPKAEHIQGVLAGISQAVGGDHTTDSSRLLRVPGSWNRKDERNGKAPVLTALVECDANRRYPLSVFEGYMVESEDAKRTAKILLMPLPKQRKLTASKADKLMELRAACAIAAKGTRSEVDFAFCCFALKNGMPADEAWGYVENVGKFAEQGRPYFDRTWEKATYDVQSQTLDKIESPAKTTWRAATTPSAETANVTVATFGADHQPEEAGDPDPGGPIIYISPERKVADTLREISDALLGGCDCYSRSEQLVVIHGEDVRPIISSAELAGQLNERAEVYVCDDDDAGQYKPLPVSYGTTWLNKPSELARIPKISLFTRNPVFTDDYRLIPPGYDPPSGIYYAGKVVEPRSTTEYLDKLLDGFCFKDDGSKTNYIGMLVTSTLMPQFVGSKPALILSGNQHGLGKSILAQGLAALRDGHTVETITYNPNDEELEKRLGAVARRGPGCIIVDNAKARGRTPRIDSAVLERSITDPVLSFRLLGQSLSIRIENSAIFVFTTNTSDVSPDLLSRSVVCNLYFEGNPKKRKFSIRDPEGYAMKHRAELLGEILGMVEKWKVAGQPLADVRTRFDKRNWGPVIGGILAACGRTGFMENAEAAAEQMDEARREFAELVVILAETLTKDLTGK